MLPAGEEPVQRPGGDREHVVIRPKTRAGKERAEEEAKKGRCLGGGMM